MEPSTDRDIARLRQIARRVGELANGRPEVVERLRQAWTDYVALHFGHMEEEREKALLQRRQAIEVLKSGAMNEHPRQADESPRHLEPFRVRFPAGLAEQARRASTPAELAAYHANLAAAISRYVRDEDDIVSDDPERKRRGRFKRRLRLRPFGRCLDGVFTVGVGVRPEFRVSPHPLYCYWREFQSLPLATRTTVSLATLAVLHDELSATPLLEPIPSEIPNDAAEAHRVLVAWAIRECLSATEDRSESREPPSPDPARLSVERAEQFMLLLGSEIEAMKKKAMPSALGTARADQRESQDGGANLSTPVEPDQTVEVCPAANLKKAVEWYLEPVDATLKAADGGARAKDGESVIVKLSMLPPGWGIDMFRSRFLGFQDWLRSPEHAAAIDARTRRSLIQHAANYPKTIRPLIRYDGHRSLGTLSMPRHAIEELRLDAKCMISLASPAGTGSRSMGNDQVVWIRADDACKRFHVHPDTINKRARREKWSVRRSGKMNCYSLADMKRIWFAKQSPEDQLRSD